MESKELPLSLKEAINRYLAADAAYAEAMNRYDPNEHIYKKEYKAAKKHAKREFMQFALSFRGGL